MRYVLAMLALACCALPADAAKHAAAKPATQPAAGKSSVDPLKQAAEQRAAIMESLGRGEGRERACAAVAQRFSLRCVVWGSDFILSRGEGVRMTYFMRLRIPAK